ncbi:DUF4494 domain-containing protein [Marinilongibacter aquaticus]|uniref:DUF4494 domain-containing protein n=1 Tax=Marinilongibacter aquaticus TaxID=2975157 RepID=UPI0021BDC2A7|nr:DUF4494 domain-containing protein [Marinilongibacter aquaticus]UBM60612.1 DUF4494 domain-containing protein [Marinilongibacter aquaticus]
MSSWYQTKIKFQQVVEDDKVKNITEAYLFDAMSYTEAEAHSYDYLSSLRPNFEMQSITKMKLAEVFMQENGAETWFKCRVQYIIFDEKTNSEKKTAVNMLINADNVKHAYESLAERLGTVEDYIISDINATKILDVVPYEEVQKSGLTPMSELETRLSENVETTSEEQN